jgi:hypothetical protein
MRSVGTAMGLAVSMLSLGNIVISPIAGVFIDQQHSYTPILMLFFALTMLGLILSVVWNVLDYTRYRIINNPSKEFMTPELSVASVPAPVTKPKPDYGTI